MNVTPLAETRGAGTSPAARLRSFRRPSMSHVLIALAVVLAFTFNFLALQDREESVLVAVASHPIDAGSRVSPGDIRFVSIDAGFEGLGTLVDEARWDTVAGWVATRPIPEDGAIPVDGLSRPVGGDGMRSMSIPVPIEHAAGGLLEVGDVVDVITVSDDGPKFVVASVEVVGVAAGGSGGISGIGGYHVILSVDADQALLLAGAIDTGSIEVVRSTGAPPIDGGPDE